MLEAMPGLAGTFEGGTRREVDVMTQAQANDRRMERLEVIRRVAALEAEGYSFGVACVKAGASESAVRRWRGWYEAGGYEGLDGGKSSGRPAGVELTAVEAREIRRRYVRSNLRRGAGSMTFAARSAALDAGSGLRPEVREAILKRRRSKHTLPVEVRRACRGETGDAAVAFFRDARDARLAGPYAPGMLRMVREPDGSIRRLRVGERQSWDDASVNFCVTVPWPWGGDACSERWGVRVGRFQLLAGIDDTCDFCVGWGYVIRYRDSYRANDVVATVGHAWGTQYAPERVMFEGGAWQADRTREFLRLAGVAMDDAKGRPHSKLIEGWWNRLWTPLSVLTDGQIGRFRGEMKDENDLLVKCQKGSADPRRHFCALDRALGAIREGIGYLQSERVESPYYGQWVPREYHAAGMARREEREERGEPLSALAPGWEHLTARERVERTVRRGMLRVTALSPLGEDVPYSFCSERLAGFEGARVWVAFDPFESRHAELRAHVSLARAFRDLPAGTVVDAHCECVSASPRVLMTDEGRFFVEFAAGEVAAKRAKRLAGAVVQRELRSVDARGERAVGVSTLAAPDAAPDAVAREFSLGGMDGAERAGRFGVPADAAPDAEDVDLEALERQAGVFVA